MQQLNLLFDGVSAGGEEEADVAATEVENEVTEAQEGGDEAETQELGGDEANFHMVVDCDEDGEEGEGEDGGAESDGTESSLHPEENYDLDDRPAEEGPGCPEWVAKKKVPVAPSHCPLTLSWGGPYCSPPRCTVATVGWSL
jgi:hypothetical protein